MVGLGPEIKLLVLFGGLFAAVIPIPFSSPQTVIGAGATIAPAFWMETTGPNDWTLSCRVDGIQLAVPLQEVPALLMQVTMMETRFWEEWRQTEVMVVWERQEGQALQSVWLTTWKQGLEVQSERREYEEMGRVWASEKRKRRKLSSKINRQLFGAIVNDYKSRQAVLDLREFMGVGTGGDLNCKTEGIS